MSIDELLNSTVTESENRPAADADSVVTETDYWICTCGCENEGTDICEMCDLRLHDREPQWATEPVICGEDMV